MTDDRSELKRFKNLIHYNRKIGGAVLTDNNEIQIYTDGTEKFRALCREIRKAQKYIHLQYYIIREDELWRRLEKLLIKKVAQGVEVRILFDGLGCRHIHPGKWKRLKNEGIQAERSEGRIAWNQSGEKERVRWGERLNCRNHRKIVVIDGKIGFLGGYNIGREYLGRDKRFGYWRDTHICIKGDAVITLVLRFAWDWYYATGENLFLKEHLFVQTEYTGVGHNAVQIISSGPDSPRPLIRDNYLYLIKRARKGIWIQTPYFIPDPEIKRALFQALERNVKIKIMIPCKPDHPFVYWATYSYIGEMLRAGAECYRYENGFLHAKCMCVDGEVTCIGSANMDIRSFRLNCEVNAVIFGRETAEEYKEIFGKDKMKCSRILRKDYQNRTLWIWILEKMSRLLSPIL